MEREDTLINNPKKEPNLFTPINIVFFLIGGIIMLVGAILAVKAISTGAFNGGIFICLVVVFFIGFLFISGVLKAHKTECELYNNVQEIQQEQQSSKVAEAKREQEQRNIQQQAARERHEQLTKLQALIVNGGKKMDTINIVFLEQEYSLPGDILSYMEYQQYFSLLRQELLSFMLDGYSDCEKWPSLDRATNKFRETAEKCVKLLCEKGVYDKTVNDFIENNEGYTLYEQVVKDTLLRKADILMSYIKNLQTDIVNAEQEAASNITGMGFSILSSSIIDLGVFAAMEHSTLKKQAAAADAQYNAMVAAAEQRGKQSSNRQTADLNANYWLPKMNESVTVYIAALFSKFIDALIEARKFDATTRTHLDIKRAEMIIQNVNSAADKKQLIREAFIKCPFCPAVYSAVVKMGLFQADECNTARTFRMLDGIEADVLADVERITMDTSVPESAIIPQITSYANISAVIQNAPVSAVMEQYLSKRRKKVVLQLQRLEKIDGQSGEFDRLMRTVFAEEMEDIFQILRNGSSTREVLNSMLNAYINRDVLHNDNSEYYSNHKQKTLEAIEAKALAYIQEAIARYNAYKEKAGIYTKVNTETSLQIADLNNERQKLGLFGFSRRKSIDAEILSLQEQVTEAKQAMRKARKYWEKMYKGVQ